MKREIKFRIRLKDKESGGIISIYNNIFDTKVGIAWYEIDKNTWELISADQYTGFKNNDKEYYEGDIVTVKGRKKIGNYITSIVFKKQGFTLKENKTYLNDDSCFIAIIDKIGNIYENPELLK
jgi:uncharacterized phage protein (TIGR01671 family)